MLLDYEVCCLLKERESFRLSWKALTSKSKMMVERELLTISSVHRANEI